MGDEIYGDKVAGDKFNGDKFVGDSSIFRMNPDSDTSVVSVAKFLSEQGMGYKRISMDGLVWRIDHLLNGVYGNL